jgi:Tol biopolymer transport system component
MIMDRNATNLRQVTGNNWPDEQPHVSPDGRKIAFRRTTITTRLGKTTTRDDIYTMDSDGRNQINLTSGLSQSLKYSDPRWSRDGSRIIYVARADRGIDDNVTTIWSIRPGGSGNLQLTSTTNATDADPDYNSTATEIVFGRYPRNFLQQIIAGTFSNDWKIVKKNLNTGVETILAVGTALTCPTWLRDNSGILFAGNTPVGMGAIREVIQAPAAGGTLRMVSATYDVLETYVEIRN